MKKITALTLAVLSCVFVLAGCSSNDDVSSRYDSSTSSHKDDMSKIEDDMEDEKDKIESDADDMKDKIESDADKTKDSIKDNM